MVHFRFECPLGPDVEQIEAYRRTQRGGRIGNYLNAMVLSFHPSLL
jgi:hypothetical protein